MSSTDRSASKPAAGRGRGRNRSVASQPSTPGTGASTPVSGYSSAAESSMTERMAKLQVEPSIQPMQRPDIGTAGRKIELETNFFRIETLMTKLILYRYEVQIVKPPRGGRGRGRIMTSAKDTPYESESVRQIAYATMRKCIRQIPNVFTLPTGIAYDRSKTLFSIEKLKLPNGKLEWTDPDAPNYVVKVTPATEKPIVKFEDVIDAMMQAFEVSTADRAIAQLLDIVTNQHPYDQFCDAEDKNAVYAPYGRQFYKPMKPVVDIGCGRVAYDGYFKSVRMVMGEPGGNPVVCLNIDAKKGPFYKAQPLIETIRETLRLKALPSRPLSRDEIKILTHHLKDVKVKAVHNDLDYTIGFISEKSASAITFNADDGRETSVEEYMSQRYHWSLSHPELPCVVVRTPTGFSYLPVELLTILPNQKVDLKKSTPEQSSQLIKVSARDPVHRREEILQKVNACGGGPNDPYAQQFGLKRSVEMMRVSGRLLNPPRLQASGNNVIQVSGGSWDLQRSKVHSPAKITKWASIGCLKNYVGGLDQQLKTFLMALANKCREMGIDIVAKPANLRSLNSQAEIAPAFKYYADNGFEFVVCFIEENDAVTRNLIKYHGGVERDIVTSCITRKTVTKKAAPATYVNIGLKINVKNGGVNFGLQENDPIVRNFITNDSGVLYLGFDVNHPPPLSRAEIRQGLVPKEPSIVGAVANASGGVETYSGLHFLQDLRQEEISEEIMHECVKRFVEMFRESTGKLPTSVVVFRDGVSESQYKMVLQKETYALKNALLGICGDAVPVTVVVCQKRHHTRFFQINMRASDRASVQNIPAGTVVDTGPVSPKLFDFYLCSHTGLQGTSKATKYIVLKDENKFTADSLQRLTYVLAHVYQRCSKSVSLPAPVYFAHHAATRGKELYNAYVRGGREDSSSGISTEGASQAAASASALLDFSEIQAKIQCYTNRTIGNMTFL